MSVKRGISVSVPVDLHEKVKDELGEQTMSQYIIAVLEKHFNKEGNESMKGKRTLAVQIDEELFERIKDYLTRHKMKQKDFVVGIIEPVLAADEAAHAGKDASDN